MFEFCFISHKNNQSRSICFLDILDLSTVSHTLCFGMYHDLAKGFLSLFRLNYILYVVINITVPVSMNDLLFN